MMRRRGATLVETTVVIFLTTVITTMILTTVVAVMRAGKLRRETSLQMTTLARFAEEFRDNVRAATKFDIVEHDGRPTELTLELASGTRVDYSAVGENLRVLESVAEKRTRADTYRFSEGSEATFRSATDGGASFVTFELVQTRTVGNAGRRFQVDAHFGALVSEESQTPQP